MSDRERGLWSNEPGEVAKFEVRRTDGRDAPGEKHDGCAYFVLDLTHDPHARSAALVYAACAREDGYVRVADDLIALVAAQPPAPQAQREGAQP